MDQKQQEKKLSNMRIVQNVIFVIFIVVLATHNFALRKEINGQEIDISQRELELRSMIREFRLQEKKWREGYASFEANKPAECKKLLEAAAAEPRPTEPAADRKETKTEAAQ